MNKEELISSIAHKTGLTKKDAAAALDVVVSSVLASVKDGERMAIPNLGVFDVRVRAARKGVNPGTGKPIQIKAATLPVFRPSKALKEAAASKKPAKK